MKTNASLGAYGIMYVVRNRKSEVLGLLLKNGVVVSSNASDMTIALAVTNLLKVSKSFYLEFTKLLISQDTINAMSVNMSGYTNFTGDAEWCKDTKNITENPNAYKLLCENKDVKSTSKVEDYINAELSDKKTYWFSCLITSDHKIQIGDEVFWDWEDHFLKLKK